MVRFGRTCLIAFGLCAALIATPSLAQTLCVGGAENGNLEAGEQCDGNGDLNDCCTGNCTFAPDNTLCDDNNDCSVNTKCDASGDCGGGSGAPNGTHCRQRDTSGNPENCMEYLCQGKACTDEVVYDPCDDDDPCTQDICTDPATQTCSESHPTLPEESPCDSDDDVCTVETCDALGECVQQSTIDCSTQTPPPGVCEFYACDPSDGSCDLQDKPKGTSCTSDNNDCTDDECNARGDCKHFGVPAGTQCSDGNACTIGEQCNAHKTCGPANTQYAGSPPNDGRACPDDGNPCTNDYCEDNSTVCIHTINNYSGGGNTNGMACTDANPCSDASACTSGICLATSCLSAGNCGPCGGGAACDGVLPDCGCQ
jgi:hypothetical protein